MTTTGNKTLAEILKQSDKELDEKTAAEMKKNKRAGIPGDEEINRKLREGDMNVDEAQKQIEAARAALREAGMEGQYEGLLREAEAGIRDYKNKRRK